MFNLETNFQIFQFLRSKKRTIDVLEHSSDTAEVTDLANTANNIIAEISGDDMEEFEGLATHVKMAQSNLEVTADTAFETAELAKEWANVKVEGLDDKDVSYNVKDKLWDGSLLTSHRCLEKLEDLKKTCYKCEHGNKHRGSFKLHMKGQHGDGSNYKSNIGLKQHFQVKHEFKDDICNNCNYKTKNKQAPHTHQRGKHKNCNSNHYKKIRTFSYDFQNTNLRSHAEHKRNDALDDMFNTPEAPEDNYLEDFLDMENDALEKVSDNYLEDTHISSTGLDELNEDLTNLKNKTKIILTMGATATWNKS